MGLELYGVHSQDPSFYLYLPNINNTVDAIKVMTDPKNIELFASKGVLSEAEVHARQDVLLEHYVTHIII